MRPRQDHYEAHRLRRVKGYLASFGVAILVWVFVRLTALSELENQS